MRYALYSFCLLLFQPLFGQDKLPPFGQIDPAMLSLKSCPFEPGADAMVLIDYRKIYYEPNPYIIRIITDRRIRIKVFNEKGFDHANITIPYVNRGRKNRIKDISAVIYNLDANGKLSTVKIDKKQIYKNKSDDEVRKVSFTFPGIKPGSVVEYRYTQVEINTLRIEPWFIQSEIPVENIFCHVEIPNLIPFSYLKNYKIPVETKDTLSREKVSGRWLDRNIKFFAKDVPSFHEEPFMSSLKDNLQRVDFSFRPPISFLASLSTRGDKWEPINQIMLESPLFGKQFDIKIDGTTALIDSAKKLPTKDEKVRFIFERVRNQVKWDRMLSNGAEDLHEVWKTGSGNTAEINLLLLNLLRKADVKCIPLLISTRKNGKVNKSFISIGQFNSVVVWIPDSTQTLILDASRKYASHKTTPYETLNRSVFAIDTAGGQWLSIIDPRPLHKQAVNVLASFDSTENLSGEAAVFLSDYAKEFELESRDKDKDEEDEEEAKKYKAYTIRDYSESDANDPLKPLMQKFKFNYEITHTNDLYYFNPVFLSSLQDNPFTAETRQTDIDLGPNQLLNFTVILNLPKNFIVDFIPGNVWLRNEDSTISFQRIAAVEPTRAIFRITLEIKQAIFLREEYAQLRDFYKKIFALLNEQIVLKKVE